jgi:hypothetical protein
LNDRYFKRKSEGILNIWDVARFGKKKAKKFDKGLLNRQRRVLEKRALIKEEQTGNI